ncbi:unnamed protein product, partial [Closterium sp. NIES-54]
MGQSGSREELIRHAAKHGDTGRTPLIPPSSRAEGYEAAKLLLQMGEFKCFVLPVPLFPPLPPSSPLIRPVCGFQGSHALDSRQQPGYEAAKLLLILVVPPSPLFQPHLSTQCVDSKGRTPLILASSRAEGYEAAKLLLQMGAHVHAYCKGPGGGTAIHHATRKQLDATVKLLLDHGADPLLPNDERKSALDLARATAVVRLIESRVALFEGYVRLQTLSAPSLVKAFIPQWVYRRIWVAVLPEPTMSDGRQTFRLKLYPSMAFGTPYFTIALHVCRIHLTKLDSANPVLVIEDPVHDACMCPITHVHMRMECVCMHVCVMACLHV